MLNKLFICLALFCSLHAKEEMVKVLITHDVSGVVLEVKGKYHIYDPHTKQFIGTRVQGKRKLIQPLKDGLKWGESFPDLFQLVFVPDSDHTTFLIDGIEFQGNVYIYDIGGTISVVNEIPIESYLESVLVPQFDTTYSPETMATVVIAARTHAYHMAHHSKSHFWSVEAAHMGYDGIGLTKRRRPMEEAIERTRGMIMRDDRSLESNPLTFCPEWGSESGGKPPQKEDVVFSQITLFQAEEMAQAGSDAGSILLRAYPKTKIGLIPKRA